MKCAMLFQDLFTTLHSSSMKTGLAWSHYINLRNISYLYKWDRYAQYNISILILVVLRCLFQAIPSLVQLLLQVIQCADYGNMLKISLPCLSSAADPVRTIDRISWYNPRILFSVDGLTRFDHWDKSKEEKSFFSSWKLEKLQPRLSDFPRFIDWHKNVRDFGCLSTCWLGWRKDGMGYLLNSFPWWKKPWIKARSQIPSCDRFTNWLNAKIIFANENRIRP